MKIPKILFIFIGLAFTIASLEHVHAAVFDCPAGDVGCLIDSINLANANGEDDKINLAVGSYILTDVNNIDDGPNGLPSITSKITIIGKGASMTFLNRDLDAPSFRIFNVKENGELELRQLTISKGNGDSGGGILNGGTLSLTDCIVRENHAGWSGAGIYNSFDAKLDILRSTLRNNTADGPGGGIRILSNGMVNIKESSIIDNTAAAVGCWAGGGIDFDAGNLTIANSLISGNTSCSEGGGMTMGGDTKIENSTIAFNTSQNGGGGIHTGWGGIGYIVNSTISDNEAMTNGGGIKFGAPGFLELQNTIISGNTATMGINWFCDSDDLGASLGNNLIEDPSGCDITLLSTDLTGDPGLDDFTEDATPGKGHFPLLSNSQAIDSGNDDACPPSDQLGNPRVDGDNDGIVTSDIGAIESQLGGINDYVTFVPDPSTFAFSPDTTDCQAGAVGKFSFDATLTNISVKELSDLHVEVDELANNNLLLTDNGLIGEGGQFAVPEIDDYDDGILSHEEMIDVPFTVCLQEKSPFRFFVNVLGVAKNPPNFAPVPKTGQTQSYAGGDDGDLQVGVQWPDPRFTDNGDGTVSDHLTGLIWLKNANCFGQQQPWSYALDVSNTLADGQCGLSDGSVTGDWRLPNIRELHSLIDFENYDAALPTGHPFQNVQSGNYGSSTSHAGSGTSMLVGMGSGVVIDSYHAGWGYVWPVRGGKDPPNFAPVPRTGQTESRAAGDDGDLQMGVQWPDPRFTDNGDGTVTDHLTGLIWLKNADCFGSKNWDDALDVSNTLADGQCGLSDGSVTGDWRLPNIRELHSLHDFGKYPPMIVHPFNNVHYDYWASTTDAASTDKAWHVRRYGFVSGYDKDTDPWDEIAVWPVRGGN